MPIIIKSRDHLNLICYLTKSFDYKEGVPRKLILNIHGGPMFRDSFEMDIENQLFANRGYSVLTVNYRGSTGFGKKFTNAGNMNLEGIRNDIIDCVNWAITNKIADKIKLQFLEEVLAGTQPLMHYLLLLIFFVAVLMSLVRPIGLQPLRVSQSIGHLECWSAISYWGI